jgi:neutral ceramidase
MKVTTYNRRSFLKVASSAPLLGAVPPVGGTAPVRTGSAGMKAGTAKLDVTPTVSMVCANGRKPDPPVAYAPIFARCLTLSDGANRMVIVTYDFNCLDVATPILREKLETELGIGPEYLVLLATHNHQSPIQIVPDNFSYGRWLAEKIFDLVKEAISREDGPVELEFGFGHGHFIVSTGSAATDYEVQLLKVSRENRPVAFLFNHPTHPLSGPDGYGPSHPGFAMDEIEARFPGSLALYGDACGGNQFCLPPPGVTDRLEACRRRGHDLAEVVFAVLGRPMTHVTGPIKSQLKVVDLSLGPPLSYDKALELAGTHNVPLDIGFVPFPDRRRPHNWVRALIKHYKEGRPFPTKSSDYSCTDCAFLVPELPLPASWSGILHAGTDGAQPRKYECRYEEVLAAEIGPMKLVCIQGEPCAPIGARIKDVLRRKGPAMVFGYFAEHNLYIPTREIVRQDVYQSQVLRIQYASPVGWSGEVEDEIVKGTLALYGEEVFERRRTPAPPPPQS